MLSPFVLPPSADAQEAAQKVIERVHAYMRMHPESELHKCGKMFGVLVVEPSVFSSQYSDNYLAAFSAKLDGSYEHEGFVPPVYAMTKEPIGKSKEESRRLQKLLFANYNFVNGKGESKNLLQIFKEEKPIIPIDEWFSSAVSNQPSAFRLPPSGAGECCAPKLLQYALTHGLKPIALAEFWVGAPSRTEIRQEGAFYAPCSGKRVPILKHVLEGLQVTGYRLPVMGYGEPKILFEDDYLMVVNKPAGLLSVPGKNDEPSVEDYFKLQISNCKFIKAVHRLDQDTSGLLVLANLASLFPKAGYIEAVRSGASSEW